MSNKSLLSKLWSFRAALGFNAGSHLASGDNNIYLGNTGVAVEYGTMRLGPRPVPSSSASLPRP